MRPYIEQLKNVFKQEITYRADSLLNMISGILFLLVQIYIWRALMGATGQVSTSAGVIDTRDMATYVVISSVISVLLSTTIFEIIDDRIRTGQIAMDILKPVNFQALMFSTTIGTVLRRSFSELLPVLLIGIIFFHIKFPSLENFLFFLIAVSCSVLINFFITYGIALFAFWYPAPSWHWSRLYRDLMRFLSGSLIPLWFFPSILVQLSQFLPFKHIFFTTISIYLGRVDRGEIVLILLQQIFWIVSLYGLAELIWRQGIRKLVIQGG